MKRFIFFVLFTFTFWILAILPTYAVCPVCTVTIGAAVGLSRWLKIDDTVTSLWIGALIVSISMWTINWLKAKGIRFPLYKFVTFATYYAFSIIPLYYVGIMGHALNTLWGIDKLLLGIIIGSIVFFGIQMLYNYMKKKNNGHAYFPYQKIAMPVVSLGILSLIFYFITKK